MIRIAIIGAGLSGLSVASLLKDKAQIILFEKARGVSGRMSTRRAAPYFFDHGAQYFTARTQAFQDFIQPFIEQGIITPWHARYVKLDADPALSQTKVIQDQVNNATNKEVRYVGVPSMNSMAKHLAKEFDIRLNTRIAALTKDGDIWTLKDENNQFYSGFDWVIITAPSPQTIELVPTNFRYYNKISTAQMQACFALMLGFEQALPIEFDTAHVTNADINWLAVNSEKPDRSGQFSLVVHSSGQYADAHIDEDRDTVMQHLIAETSRVLGLDLSVADYQALHGWRYASNSEPTTTLNHQPALLDSSLKLAVCGDWCSGGRVEGAFTSAHQLVNSF